MGSLLRTFFLILIWAGILAMQTNFDMDDKATYKLKNALELAVHDAALALDTREFMNGKIIFDQVVAEQNFRKSLEDNLRLNNSLEPLTDSFFKEPIVLKHLEYVDHSIGTTFPMNYINDKYHILDTLEGPGIVAVLETSGPRYFTGNKNVIRQAVVYQYKRIN
jgi:hypothetical protein